MKESRLFTPGPLTTSAVVKQAMLHDVGSRDAEFIELVARIRADLLQIAGVSKEVGYEAIPMQGSGTFAIESVFSSVIPPNGRLLILANGAYGERMLQIAERLKIPTAIRRWPEDESPDADAVAKLLEQDPRPTHVAVVHLETTTGILNPIDDIARVGREHGCQVIVDAMSSFGGVRLDLNQLGIDYLISSANKCLESVPGFAIVIARRDAMETCKHSARSVSLDLIAQWQGLERDGQFRFTPPTHVFLAFAQALTELQREGGVTARADRYRANHEELLSGMRRLGFREYLRAERQSDVITAFHYPSDERFVFEEFYRRLAEKGMVIYPGKVSQTDCFRIGTIGRITVEDVRALIAAIGDVLSDMGVKRMTG